MIHPNRTSAVNAARANARYFKVPYVVFTDTSGNLRVEQYDATLTCHNVNAEVFRPPEKE